MALRAVRARAELAQRYSASCGKVSRRGPGRGPTSAKIPVPSVQSGQVTRGICAGQARAAAERASFNPLVQGSTPWRLTCGFDSFPSRFVDRRDCSFAACRLSPSGHIEQSDRGVRRSARGKTGREIRFRKAPNRGRGRDADRARQAGNQGSTQGPRPAAGHPLRACRSAANQSSSQCGGRSMRSRSSSSGSVYSPQPASVSSLCSGSRGLPAAVAASSEPVEPRRKDMRLGYVSDSA